MTTTIEDQAQALLENPVLKEAVRRRAEAGVAKYGQRLEENHQPMKARAVHLVQELLDGCQYALWLGNSRAAARLATEADLTVALFGLTLTDIMEGGKQ